MDHHYMTSYQPELRGICAGLMAMGVLSRSGLIHIRSVRIIFDNESVVKRCKQKLTASIFHNTESDWGLLKTYHS
jgi:hypothetical protein